MQNNKILWIGSLIVIVFIAWIALSGSTSDSTPSPLDAFAQCLTDKGLKYYGAFWCPNCAKQNALFGKSKKFVNYTECSTPDGQGQLQVCKDAKIMNYPTWEIPAMGEATTSSRLIGTQELSTISQISNCQLPK